MTPIPDERLQRMINDALDEGESDNLVSALTELQSLRAQGGVRVKALEWHGDNGHGAGFKYVIAEPCRTPGWRVWANLTEIGPNGMATSIGAHIVTMKAENRDDAKAAAQADYERRVLSSLEASPAPVSEECATDGCFTPATVHFERGGVGSKYCHSCYLKVQALTGGSND